MTLLSEFRVFDLLVSAALFWYCIFIIDLSALVYCFTCDDFRQFLHSFPAEAAEQKGAVIFKPILYLLVCFYQ